MWIDVFFDLRAVPVSLLILTANQKHVSSHLVLEHVLGMVGPWFHGRMDFAIWIWLKVRTDVGLGGVQLIEVPGLNEQSSISWFAKTSSGPTFPKSQMKEGSSGRSKVNLADIYIYCIHICASLQNSKRTMRWRFMVLMIFWNPERGIISRDPSQKWNWSGKHGVSKNKTWKFDFRWNYDSTKEGSLKGSRRALKQSRSTRFGLASWIY